MTQIQFPYGKEKLTGKFSEGSLAAVLTSQMGEYIPKGTGEELVEAAMANPIGTPHLSELAKGKKKIVIIASDHTRPVPSKVIIPPMLRQIRSTNPEADITILIATGCHRGTTVQELEDKFGPEIVKNEKIYVHDCDEREKLVNIGTLPSGGTCEVNTIAMEADLLISEGFIEPHFFAGFSGGRKSVLPGIASRTTVLANHCSEFIAHPCARTGILENNPVHADMLWAAEHAKLTYIVNVVLNEEKEVIYAVAGDLRQAHAAGVKFLSEQCGVKAVPADIVISTNGGYPLDQNIYQAVKGMTAAEATVKQGGVIIMLAKSNDGHGGAAFCRELMAGDDMDALMADILRRGRGETLPDQWQAQIMIRILQRAKVVYISDAEDELVEKLHMTPAHSLEEALVLAAQMVDAECPMITAIPDGVGVIVHAGKE